MGALVTAAAIAGAATLASGAMASKGAKDAARQANRGTDAAIAEQQAAREQFQQNIQPYLGAGTGALSQLQALNAGDFSSFYESPDYAYTRDQMQQGIERGAAARGSLYSGGTNVDLAGALGGLASQNYSNFYNRLSNLATMGQNAAVGAGSMGQNTANALGGLYTQQGENSANAAIGQANAYGNALAGLGSIAGQYMANRPQQPAQQPATDWGAFTPNQTFQAPAPQYTGFNPQTGSAFGQWGQGWT